MNDWISVTPGRPPRRAGAPATADRDSRARRAARRTRPTPTAPGRPQPAPVVPTGPYRSETTAVCGACSGTGMGGALPRTWTAPLAWGVCPACAGTGRVRVLTCPPVTYQPWWSTVTGAAPAGS